MRARLPRPPDVTDALLAVRTDHNGYQAYGQTALDAVRAAKRDRNTYAAHLLLTDRGQRWLTMLGPDQPRRHDFQVSRVRLTNLYPADQALQRDLRNCRYNSQGPLTATELADTLVDATSQFRRTIEDSAGRGNRKGKKRVRRQAWTKLNATLAGVALASVADANPRNRDARMVGAGALR